MCPSEMGGTLIVPEIPSVKTSSALTPRHFFCRGVSTFLPTKFCHIRPIQPVVNLFGACGSRLVLNEPYWLIWAMYLAARWFKLHDFHLSLQKGDKMSHIDQRMRYAHADNNASDLLDIPFIGVAFIMASVAFMHILFNTLLSCLTTKNTRLSNSLFHGLHSIITPPLHTDWEMYYRNADGKQSIIRCWHR